MREAKIAYNRQKAGQIADVDTVVFYGVESGGWNDFSKNFFAGVLVKLESKEIFDNRISLMFEGYSNTTSFIRGIIANPKYEGNPIEDIRYISILPDDHLYGRLVQIAGRKEALDILRAMHDCVLIRWDDSLSDLRDLVSEQAFWYGALRGAGTYNAMRRAHRHLVDSKGLYVEDAAKSFDFSQHLYSADNPYVVRFDFEPDPIGRNRINVLIGENGTGKTQLFMNLISNLSNCSIERLEQPKCNKVIVFSSIASDNYPRELSIDSSVDYQYFSLVAVTNDGQDATTSAFLDCIRDDQRLTFTFGDSLFADRLSLARHLLANIQLAENIYLPLTPDSEKLSVAEIEIEGRAYHPIEKGLNEQRQLQFYKRIDPKSRPLVLDKRGQPRQLSSGENSVFRFIAQISGSIETGSMLLLDEPETHLHPRYISFMMDVIGSLLDSSLSIAIIATHSIYIVREVPKQRVNILSLDDRQIEILNPRLQTFGSNVDAISRFIFLDPAIGQHYQSKLRAWADTLSNEVDINHLIDVYGSELNQETLSYVSQYLRGDKP